MGEGQSISTIELRSWDTVERIALIWDWAEAIWPCSWHKLPTHSSGALCEVASSSTQSSSSQVMPRRPGTLRVAPGR